MMERRLSRSTGLLAIALLLAACLVPVFSEGAYAGTEGVLSYTVSDGEATVTGCDDSVSGKLVIPDTLGECPVTGIGIYAFEGCTALESIAIPNSVTNIGDHAFSGCTLLAGVTIPRTVISIGFGAFSGCTSLTNVAIPESVTSIGVASFSGCTSLASFSVASGNMYYSSVDGVIYDRYKKRLVAYPCGNPAKDFVIPSSVTSIGGSAFSGCTSLSSVDIPESVAGIDSYAFEGCTALENVTIPRLVKTIWENTFKGCTSLASITIPNSITSIGYSAFEGCASLASVTIGGAVMRRGFSTVFPDCPNISDIVILDSGDIRSIPESAFRGCASLGRISIPRSVEDVGDGAFLDCTGLSDVFYGGTESEWGSVSIGVDNEDLLNASFHFESMPAVPVYVPGVEATCVSAGSKPYYRYEGKNYEDAACTKEIVDLASWVALPAAGHKSAVLPAVDSTCTETGFTEGSECSVCGEVLKAQETVAKTAHIPEAIPAVAATCTSEGKTEGSMCSVCHEVLKAQEAIAKTAHSPEVMPAVEATATESGLTEGSKCSVCGEVLKAQQVVPKKAAPALTAAQLKMAMPSMGAKISKLTGAKKALTVKWKRQSGKVGGSNVTGYQVRYSTKASMKSAKLGKFVRGFKTTSCKVTKLKAKTRYYVQVRTYMKFKGKTYYSGWSKAKNAKTG